MRDFLLPGGSASAPQTEEKTTFDVILEDIASDKRVSVLKPSFLCYVTSLGLKEKLINLRTNSLPKVVKAEVSKEEAET